MIEAVAALIMAAPAAQSAALFQRGQFAAAAQAGRAERGVAGLTIAARATLVRAAYQAADRAEALALIDQAERDADAALRIAPTDYDALLQKAAATGYRARLATSRTLGQRTHALLAELTRRSPDRIGGWVALGVWHGEAVDKLGTLGARMVLGGSRAGMERALAEAARRDPASPVPPADLALLKLRLDGDGAGAQPLLDRAAKLAPRDGYEALIRRHANEVAALLTRGDARAARARAEALAPFGGLTG